MGNTAQDISNVLDPETSVQKIQRLLTIEDIWSGMEPITEAFNGIENIHTLGNNFGNLKQLFGS